MFALANKIEDPEQWLISQATFHASAWVLHSQGVDFREQTTKTLKDVLIEFIADALSDYSTANSHKGFRNRDMSFLRLARASRAHGAKGFGPEARQAAQLSKGSRR